VDELLLTPEEAAQVLGIGRFRPETDAVTAAEAESPVTTVHRRVNQARRRGLPAPMRKGPRG
jgi:hypothetical protein